MIAHYATSFTIFESVKHVYEGLSKCSYNFLMAKDIDMKFFLLLSLDTILTYVF